jgi:hypothetical protein
MLSVHLSQQVVHVSLEVVSAVCSSGHGRLAKEVEVAEDAWRRCCEAAARASRSWKAKVPHVPEVHKHGLEPHERGLTPWPSWGLRSALRTLLWRVYKHVAVRLRLTSARRGRHLDFRAVSSHKRVRLRAAGSSSTRGRGLRRRRKHIPIDINVEVKVESRMAIFWLWNWFHFHCFFSLVNLGIVIFNHHFVFFCFREKFDVGILADSANVLPSRLLGCVVYELVTGVTEVFVGIHFEFLI